MRASCCPLARDVKVGKQAREYAVWLATVQGCPYNGARCDPVKPASYAAVSPEIARKRPFPALLHRFGHQPGHDPGTIKLGKKL